MDQLKEASCYEFQGLVFGLKLSTFLSTFQSGIATVIRIKLKNSVGKQMTTLAGIRRKLLIGKAG